MKDAPKVAPQAAPHNTPPGTPDGDEKKGRPKDDRAVVEAVMEEGLPEEEQRKPRTGSDASQ